LVAGVLVLTAVAGPQTGPAAADARACGPLPSFPAGTADQLMAGRLTIAPFPAVTIDPHRDGDINWTQNPFRNPTWKVDFQNGQWIEALVEAYLAGGPDAEAYRDRAKALLLGWLSHVPAVNKSPDTLICSAEAFPGQSWIHDRIPGLLDYYAAHWDGAWNHGLKQDLQLLTAGCAYPAQAFGGQPVKWRDHARQQMIDSFEPNPLGPVVDAQGVTNEQSTGYANFDLGLWTTAEQDLAACGSWMPGWITARIAQIPTFLAMATQPSYAVVTAPGTQLEIRQIPLPGQQIPAASTQVTRGWVSHAALQGIPAPVVTMTRTGRSAAILTLIAPTAPGVPITAAVSAASRGRYRLRVRIGGRQLTFLVSAGGDIRPG
jgi:hypothetical protein